MQRTILVVAVASGLVAGYLWDSRNTIDKQNARITQLEDQVKQVQQDTTIIKQILLEQTTGTPIAYNKKDVECLARNIYFEARGEETLGKYAVAQVTINRVKLGYWGDSICNVVYAKKQFSWTQVKKRAWVKLKGKSWEESMQIATRTLKGVRVKPLKKALFYHADYVNPDWKDPSKEITKVGQHVFYTQAKGSWLKL